MEINNSWGDLTDVSSKKEALYTLPNKSTTIALLGAFANAAVQCFCSTNQTKYFSDTLIQNVCF